MLIHAHVGNLRLKSFNITFISVSSARCLLLLDVPLPPTSDLLHCVVGLCIKCRPASPSSLYFPTKSLHILLPLRETSRHSSEL
ncbi:hypothetical protein FKM82_008549 [Ascaphus truei]